MSKQSQPILLLTLIAAGVIAEHRFVGVDSAQAGAAANTLGVAGFAADAIGDAIPVTALGTAVVETGGIINAGALIETDADGKAVAKAAGPSVARALDASGGAGEFIEVILLPN
ncbi:hypothetical protein [Pseudomonas sp.]|uniref:hypothetical protein n=1 Tax=Pseudomonas sp. TaxID=306 RepID=UPI003D0E1034